MQIENLPNDLIILFVTMLDPLSIIKLGLASHHFQWIVNNEKVANYFRKACHEDPIASAIIKAANIENDLQNGKISALNLFASVKLKKTKKLNSLLKAYKMKLFYPCYNSPPRRDNFYFIAGETYDVFLNEESGRKKIVNSVSIDHFHAVDASIGEVDFSKADQGIIYYKPRRQSKS